MNVEIITFEDHHQPAFKALNEVWLDRYHLKESHDIEILDDPATHILKNGGIIYLAKEGDVIVGSAALIKDHDNTYELAKMTVADSHQGRGISKLLLQKCIATANDLKATKIILFSNHQLKTALGLYEKFGFQHVPVEDSPFVTADVKMELVL